jgi:cobalt-zinc-cadmium resistance protein CzcA
MLEKIITATLTKKGLILFLSIIIIIGGIYSAYTITIDAFPDVTNNQVEIVSHADGLSAIEIERSVTNPIELSMKGLPNIEQMRSVTKFGLSIVTLVFKDNVDIYFARQLVYERLAEAKENIPSGVEVALGPIATVMGEIYQYTLEGVPPKDSLEKIKYYSDLRTLQEWVITPKLKNIEGVNEINSFGGYFKQYQVIVDPIKLSKYNISINEVFSAIDANNRNMGGNILENNSEQYIVRGVGLLESIPDIGNISLKSENGIPIYINDVAEVKIGEAVRMGAALKNGKEETVGGIIMMLRGANSKEVVKRVKETVETINNNNVLPKGVKIVPYYDRTDIVNNSIFTIIRALLEGSILVLIVTFVLLKSFRGSAVILIALPISLFLTFIFMKIFGISANLMSIGGLVISTGMKFDASIIQVENVQRMLNIKDKTRNRFMTVLKAILDVRKPSIYGELIIAITFIPILALEGIEGKMFAPLAITVGLAIIASLLMSIFVIPQLCSMLLKPQEEKESKFMEIISKRYLPLLKFSINNKFILLTTACVLLVSSLLLFTRIGSEFIPIMNEGAFDMDVSLLPGVSLAKSMEINQIVGKKLSKFDELGIVIGRIGQTGVALDTRGVDKTGYVGILKPENEWKRKLSNSELVDEMRDSLSSIPGIAFGFSQPIQCRIDEIVAGTRSQLILKLFGDDIGILKSKADEISNVISAVEGATDLVVEKVTGQPYITIKIDRNKIARYGLNISDVQNVVEVAIAGKSASKIYEDNKMFSINVRLPENNRKSLENISDIFVKSPNGANIPLAEIADIKMVEGPAQISRQDGFRRIGIELNIKNRDIGSFVKEAKQKIQNKIQLPPGYYITWGGQFENQQRAMTKLLIIAPFAIGLIILLLYLTFHSFRLTLLILLNLPFALIGGVLSLYISGLYLSVPASVGFIVLFGVAVLNGVVLVSHIKQLQNEGYNQDQAIVKGCMDRLRPVIMTATITIFSLLPSLISTGVGSEIQKPLATVVVGGLITSTILTLLIIPSIYKWFDKQIQL